MSKNAYAFFGGYRTFLHSVSLHFMPRRFMMDYRLAVFFGAVSVMNSFLLVTIGIDVPISRLVGSQCKNDCTNNPPHTQGECLHLGQDDPCSTITCIQNVCDLPHCTAQASGTPCSTKSALGACVQTLYDQDCSGTSGWAPQTLQPKGDCQPEIIRNRRCLAPCGSGTGYGANPRISTTCS